MKAYKLRDANGFFYSENKIPSKEYATVWYDLDSLLNHLRIRERNEAAYRNIYGGLGEQFSGPLLPKDWEIVEVSIKEISATPVTEMLGSK